MKDIDLIILTSTGTIVLILVQIRVVLRQIALTVDQWRRTVHTIRPCCDQRLPQDPLNAAGIGHASQDISDSEPEPWWARSQQSP